MMKALFYVIMFIPISCHAFCWFGCCKSSWTVKDFEDLENALKRKLFGQHIAEKIVVSHLKSHYLDPNPKKALVLSLHGTTGSGKNYLSSIVVDSLIPQKDNVKIWNAKHHFSNSELLSKYQADLKKEIHEKVSGCPRSVFIFDEVNELPAGLLDVLKPMIDEYTHLDGADYRKSTFFFLSNTGATKINEVLWKSKMNSKNRSELRLRDFQSLIQEGSFNEEGGLLRSRLIEKHLISAYVPFLPLEEEHVKMCVRYYLRSRQCQIDEKLVQAVSDLINYEPEGYKYFSPYGCRGLDDYIKQECDDSCIFNIPKDEL